MITIEQTFDHQLIKQILTSPGLYEVIKDDGSCSPDEYKHDEKMLNLLAKNGDEILGLIQFHSINSICAQGHINILPKYWGKRLDQAAIEGLKWLKANTRCLKVIAMIPEECKQVLEASKRYGFKEEGFITNSIKRNNKVQGMYILGLEF